MSWLTWLNPLNWIKLFTLIKDLIGMVMSAVNYAKEQQAKKKDQENAQAAIDDLRKAGKDETQTIEQREKDAEDAFGRFHDRLP